MSYRILIVDDSPAIHGIVRRILALSGFDAADCASAGNGAEALEFLRSRPVDLILSDINMPEMNGEEFLRALGADDKLRAIPVVILSTDATGRRTRDMLALGAKGYLTKPFKPEALRLELTRVLGGVHA